MKDEKHEGESVATGKIKITRGAEQAMNKTHKSRVTATTNATISTLLSIIAANNGGHRLDKSHHTAAGNDTGLETHALAGMKGSLPDIIWYSITPALLPTGKPHTRTGTTQRI